MGGLVVKQAYVLARQDPSLVELAKRMEAIMFLATPHRGSDLAQTLNNILRVSVALPTRSYISNLSLQNELLSLLNDSFRHYAADVSLYSFYESRPTTLPVHSKVIVEKASAVLGYPNERQAMLDANHRQVCKFESPSDPNYIAVREALHSVTETILRRLSAGNAHATARAMRQIKSFLAMPASPDDDLQDVEEARIAGSCEWLADNATFQRWADPDSEDASIAYWISANPATGKSVLSGYVVNLLTNLNLDCSYYFFRHGDKDKSTVSGFLLSLLHQMALRSAEVRQQLLSLIESGMQFNKDDSKSIWRKLARPVICNADAPTTVQYWVLDALDECSGFQSLFPVMASIKRHTRIRILITSRKLPEITEKFAELRRNPNASIAVCADEISLENTRTDIRLYLEENRHKFHVGDEKQKDAFRDRLLDKSEGCFLWAHTVLDELASAWSVSQIQRILDEVPQGMDPLYLRALAVMSSRPKPSRDLARVILTWIVCSIRPLTVAELSEALNLDLDDGIPELEGAISSLCAQLVHVDGTGRVMMVHLTARSFLTSDELQSEFRIDEKLGHVQLATICLKFLCSEKMKPPGSWRAMQKARIRPMFAGYACVEFAEHLRHTAAAYPALSGLLYKFLRANVLSWIEYVAESGDLAILVRTADSIEPYLQRRMQSSSSIDELVHLTQNWVFDLHRIVAGFRLDLLACPWGIYCFIPPFCPKSSAIATTAAANFGRITIQGLKNEDWDDCVSCIETHMIPCAVSCGDTVFAVGYHPGSIILYHNNTCLPWKTLDHGSDHSSDRISGLNHLVFDDSSTHLVSTGDRKISIWEVDSGIECWTAEDSGNIIALKITNDGKTVMTINQVSTLTAWNMQTGEVERRLNLNAKCPFPNQGPERELLKPKTAAFSPDASFLGVLYEDRPTCLYDLENDRWHGLLSRFQGDLRAQVTGPRVSPHLLTFNTKRDNPNLVVAYNDGSLYHFDYEKLKLVFSVRGHGFHAHAACSPDGKTLATWAWNGTVQLLEFDTLQIMHQVSANIGIIKGLSFSADNMRFLDVRRMQCNVWEPAVLRSMASRDGSSAESARCELVVRGPETDNVPIASIELDDSGQYFFVGRFDGSVSLIETASGKQRKVLYQHCRHSINPPVRAIVWGSKKSIIASSDTRGGFVVAVLEPDDESGWKISATHGTGVREAAGDVLQLLLNPSNELLLVSTSTCNCVWSLTTMQLVTKQAWRPPVLFRWINQPGSPAHRTLITKTTATIFEWESKSFDDSWAEPTKEDRIPDIFPRVENAFALAQSKLLVVELSSIYQETMICRLPSSESKSELLIPATGFGKLVKRIERVIGGCDARLVFLDAKRWVCSVDTSQAPLRYYLRHFPIPSDWESQQVKLIMAVTRNEDILFVRHNEVAIISRGLEFEERVELDEAEAGC